MDFLQWLEPITESLWLRTLTGVILATLLIAGVLAHWPALLPGPLTTDERARRQLPWAMRWVLNCVMLLLALASAIAIFLVLSPPRRPVELLLRSRLRPPSAASPGLSQGTQQRLDMGPVVDAVLAECRRQGAREWVNSGPGERAAVRRAFLKTLKGTEAPELSGGAEPQANPCRDLPAWLVLSVEFSVLQTAMRQYNATAARVAPGPSKDSAEGWPLAAILLSTERTIVSCVDMLPAPPEGFTVLRLTGARWERMPSQIRAWAVIHGRFPRGATQPARIGFRLSIGRPPAAVQSVDLSPLKLQPEPETVESRIASLQFAPPAGFDPDRLLAGNLPLTLSDETGNCIVPVHVLSGNPRPIELSIMAPTHAWSEALGRVSTDAEFEEVRRELRSLGEAVPRTAATGAKAPVLLVQSGWAVIAGREDIARKVLAELPSSAGVPGDLPVRVTTSRIEPGTVFSWMALPVNAAAAIPNTLSQEAAVLTSKADQSLMRGRDPSTAAGPPGPLILVGRKDAERYVIMGGTAALPPSRDDPLKLVAQVRSLCWAARYIGEGGDQELSDEDGLRPAQERGLQASPLVTALDLQEATARGVARTDKAVVLITGSYLALLLYLILKNTPA